MAFMQASAFVKNVNVRLEGDTMPIEQRAKPLAKKEYPDADWSDLPDEIGTVSYAAKEKFVRLALRDFNLIEERYAELKRRLGSSLQKE